MLARALYPPPRLRDDRLTELVRERRYTRIMEIGTHCGGRALAMVGEAVRRAKKPWDVKYVVSTSLKIRFVEVRKRAG